jgi:hypothetical protein
MENNFKLDKKGYVELFIFFFLPLFVQYLLRGNLLVRIVDYFTFLPIFILLYSLYLISLKKKFYYILILLFLLLPDYGSIIFFLISFFAALIGILFVFLPLVSVIPIYFSKRSDRLSSIPDYFNFGVKFSGISLLLLLISFAPNYIGQNSINNFPSSQIISEKTIGINNNSILIKEYKIENKTDLKAIFNHYKNWLNRPFYKNFKVLYGENNFIINFKNIYQSPLNKNFSLFCYSKDNSYFLKIAQFSQNIKTPIFQLIKKMDDEFINFERKEENFGGKYSNKDLTLLPEELAKDSGFNSAMVFLINKINGAALQVMVKSPGEGIKIEHYYYFYEEFLKKEYNNFKTIKKEKATFLNRKAFYLEGTADINNTTHKMFITMITNNEKILLIFGNSPEKSEKEFKEIYMKQLKNLRLL